jgi:putative ABC transport system ATP-binding protein
MNATSPVDIPPPDDDTIYKVVNRVGQALGMQVEYKGMGDARDGAGAEDEVDPLRTLSVAAALAGIMLKEAKLEGAGEAFAFVREGQPVLASFPDGSFLVLEKIVGRRIEASQIGERMSSLVMSRRQLRKLLSDASLARTFVANKQLECDALSAVQAHGHHDEHPTPLKRFQVLLNLDRHDIWTIFLFALVAGILALASPLAIESLVNVVSWGTYLQPLIVLGLMLLTCLGIAGVLEVLQAVVVETIQRRQLVRIVSDLAHRFPRANQAALVGQFPRELANRVFDIMTIQKATAVLLLDGVSILLTTALGMILLAFYHPFLLGFDIVLLISMIAITRVLGRGGVQTAISESITKYRLVHWLQDVLASPSAFKINGGESLSIRRADTLTADYINARKSQFRVVLRQVAFAISLQVVASTAVLALGGWLVIDGQLTLGQLVASELVVTVVVGAFAKAGKSLEKFYDLMAGIDKVGHLLDIPVDPIVELGRLPEGPATVRWPDLSFENVAFESRVPAATIEAGSRVAVVGNDVEGKSLLAKSLAGLVDPTHGVPEIAGLDAGRVASAGKGTLVAYAGEADIINATLRENVDLGRRSVRHDRVREVLAQVGLADTVLKLPNGIDTKLESGGFPLGRFQSVQIILARAMAALPRLLIIDGLLDQLNAEDRSMIWQTLAAPDAPWTLVVVTNRSDIAELCDTQVAVRKS